LRETKDLSLVAADKGFERRDVAGFGGGDENGFVVFDDRGGQRVRWRLDGIHFGRAHRAIPIRGLS
jgi:hypothetical protein